MSVSDILNRLPNNYIDVNGALDRIRKDSINLPHGHKYQSRPELDSSGLSKTYDEVQSRGVRIAGYNTASHSMEIRLMREQDALKDIKTAILQFKKELVNNSQALGTKADKAARTLDQIQFILGKKHIDGSYIFGGTNPSNPPLTYDLNSESNVVDGHILNNYSDTTLNNATIDVSSKHKIQVSYVHAGMEQISAYIGALNLFKEGDANAETILQESDVGFGQLQLTLDFALDKIKKGREVNSYELEEASKLNDNLFKEGVDVIAGRISDMRNSLFAGFAIQGLEGKIFDKLMERS